MNGRNDIIRPGQVKRQQKGALTSASEVMDWRLKKTQEEINKFIENIDAQQLEDLTNIATLLGTMRSAIVTLAAAATNGGEYELEDISEELPEYVNVETTIPSGGAKPDVRYKLGTLSTLNVTLASSTGLEEYFFDFSTTAGAANIDINFPPTIEWVDEPVWEAGRHYQVSIVANMGIVVSVPLNAIN